MVRAPTKRLRGTGFAITSESPTNTLGESYMKKLLLFTTMTAALNLALIFSAGAATYGGSATGAQVTVPATGTLSISGGAAEAALLVGDIPGSATAGVASLAAGAMHSAIVGVDETRGEASMADITLTVSNNTVTADFLMARSTASCGPAVTGNSRLTNLVINGQAITVTGAPNQTVALPNGTAIINEQIPSVVGTSAELTVNALHVTTTDPVTQQQLADVLLATVDAKIDCAAGSPPNHHSVTGGGWIIAETTGGKGTFGLVAGDKPDGSSMGHLVYIDHAIDLRVQSTSVTFNGTCTFSGEGTGTMSGVSGPVSFTVAVTDHGEPGTADTFQINVSGQFQYDSSLNPQPLSDGNIQSHNLFCP